MACQPPPIPIIQYSKVQIAIPHGILLDQRLGVHSVQCTGTTGRIVTFAHAVQYATYMEMVVTVAMVPLSIDQRKLIFLPVMS